MSSLAVVRLRGCAASARQTSPAFVSEVWRRRNVSVSSEHDELASERSARVSEVCGASARTHYEALGLFWRLYQQMTVGQGSSRSHKGMPLVWMGDCS